MIRKKIFAPHEDHPFPASKGKQMALCAYLAKINDRAITEVLPSATAGLDFLKAAIKPLVDRNRPQYWKSQSGFVAANDYRTAESTTVGQASAGEVKEAQNDLPDVLKRDTSKRVSEVHWCQLHP